LTIDEQGLLIFEVNTGSRRSSLQQSAFLVRQSSIAFPHTPGVRSLEGDVAMLDDKKRQRFEFLRRLEKELTQMEQAELSALVHEIECAEAEYLNPASTRLHEQSEAIKRQNRELEKLAERKKALLRRLQSALAEAQAEQRAIAMELATVLHSESKE